MLSKMLSRKLEVDQENEMAFELLSFDKVEKKRTTSDAITADKNAFEIQIKQLSIDNDQLLKQIMSQEIVHIAVNYVDITNVNKSCVDECNKCLEPKTELLKKKDLIEKDVYDKLLKTQSQEKDTFIRKLKDMIKSLSGKDSAENVKKVIDDIETINIELEHSVAKLLSENENLRKEREHLKSIYKDQFDSIIKTRVQSNEHCASLISQINEKPVENSDLNAQLQEKVFAIAALKNEFRKLKTCPSLTKSCEKLVGVTPMNKEKKLGVNTTTSANESKPSGNTKKNKISRPPSSNQKNKLEEHPRKVKSSLNKMNSIFEPISNAHIKHSIRNAKFESICAFCNKCLFDANHDMRVVDYVNDVNVRSKSKSKRNKMGKVWKPTSKVFNEIGYSWKPTGRTFTIVGNNSPLTRFISTKVVPTKETTNKLVLTLTQGIIVYSRKPKAPKLIGSSSKSKITESTISNSSKPTQSGGSTVSDVPSSSLSDCRLSDFGCSKHITRNYSQLINFVSKFLVALRKHTCFIRDLKGVDLLKGSRGSNLYTLSMENLLLSSPICLLSKASKTKSWLWHQRLSHLNFDYITSLAKQGIIRGLPKLKYQKDHLCYACALRKSKKHSHKPKAEDSIQEKLYLLHMDLCGPMRIQSINGRKYGYR
ncbi:retrovirus-related pol polyprotein from transposon TNT 1-94 [Tanacetum coccineum]